MAATSNNRLRFDSTQRGYIAADEGFHDFCRFSYKIAPPKLVNKSTTIVNNADRSDDGEAAYDEIVSFLARYLVDWSEEGKPSVENLHATTRAIVKTMYAIVIGTVKSDRDPENPALAKDGAETLGK